MFRDAIIPVRRVSTRNFSLGFQVGFGEEKEILTSLDGVKEFWVVSNNPLDQSPSPDTRGTNQHLQISQCHFL